MSDRDDASTEIIDDLLDKWEDANEAGQPISIDELCRSHPGLIDQVRSQITRLQAIDGRIGSGLDANAMASAKLPIQSTIEELEFLKRGGLGAVFIGEDTATRRRVAVKFLHSHLANDPPFRERFALEAEVTARLEHPGVIPMYGVGENAAGEPFYAMRFIDGESMDELIHRLHRDDANGLGGRVENDRRYRQLLSNFVSVCKTIAYAHNRGIVHRDIKPANVMLGKYGETIVVDWGLAVPVARDATFRDSGENTLMIKSSLDSGSSGHGSGTPLYMSPEQASELAPTPASDIYSLGATLFRILSGQPSVDGDTITEIKRNVIDGRIRDLQQASSMVPPALASIVGKAMSHRPTDRYDTAIELANDVEAFLADDAVDAHNESWLSRFTRLSRRHRDATKTAIAMMIVGTVAAIGGFILLGTYAARERRLHRSAEAAEHRADQMRQQSLALSAQFLSKSIGQEIDLRWRILEASADSRKLRELVASLNQRVGERLDASRGDDGIPLERLRPEQEALQIWLQGQFERHSHSIRSQAWFIQGREGTQFAQVPPGASIGRNYRYRDYFHGKGFDFTKEQVMQLPVRPGPLADRAVHMGVVYRGTNQGTLRTAFSVPIYDGDADNGDRKKVGVIGMAVELGDFQMDPHTWLIDTRPDAFGRERALLLQHPRMGILGRDADLPVLSQEWLDRLLKLRRRDKSLAAAQLSSVTDPVTRSSAQVAMQPVVVHSRSDEVADTGWVVIVSEENDLRDNSIEPLDPSE